MEDDGVDACFNAPVEEPAGDQTFEPLLELRLPGHGVQERERNAPADDGRRLDEGGGWAWKQVEARGEDTLDRLRKRARVPARPDPPTTVDAGERLSLSHRPHHLLDEERISSGAVRDKGDELAGSGPLEHALDERADPAFAKRLEHDRGSVGCHLVDPPDRVRPGDQAQQERPLSREPDELCRQPDARRVDPVEVLECDGDRSVLRQAAKPGGEGVMQASAEALRLESDHIGVGDRQAEQLGEVGLRGRVRNRRLELAHSCLGVVLGQDSGHAPEQVGVGPIREPRSV